MMERALERLRTQLAAIGFPADTDPALKLNALFSAKTFDLRVRLVRDHDVFNVVAHVITREAQYCLSHYDVTLRQYTDLPEVAVNGIDLPLLAHRLAAVDWGALSLAKQLPIEGKLWDEVVSLVDALQALTAVPEGLPFANQLKVRFWEGTQLEPFIAGLAAIRAGMEIQQRYTFFADQEAISLEEAFRFLIHRWAEKRHREKVQAVATTPKKSSRKAKALSKRVDRIK